MRYLATILVVIGLVVGNGISASEARSQEISASDYLPETLPLDHAVCFRVDGEGRLDFPALLDRFAVVPELTSQLEVLGWSDGAYRQFGCDAPPAGRTGWIDISVHRFADAGSATAAVPLFANAWPTATSLQPVAAPDLGDSSWAVTGPASNGTEYTLYASTGPLVFRVSGVAPVGDPAPDVVQVTTGLLLGSDAVALHQTRSQEALTPAATPLPAYPTSTNLAYAIQDLGTGNGNASLARSINRRGQVLWTWGTTRDPMSGLYSDPHQVISWNGMSTDLTALGLEQAIAINDLGIVLGSARDQGLLYWPDSGTVEALPGFDQDAYPRAINDLGIVTGNVGGRAVIADGSRRVELPVASGFGFLEPTAINDAGDVAGTVRASRTDESGQRAVLVADGGVTVLDAAPGAETSSAADLNDAGQLVGNPGVVGMREMHEYGRAFLSDAATGITVDIGTLPGYQNSVATAINGAGQVVGYAWLPVNDADPIRTPYLYDHRTGVMTDLNLLIPQDSGWQLVDAFDISDAGQIVGQGLIDGEMHAFVLTPVR